MSANRPEPSTLRTDRLENSRLVWALVLSLLFHGLGYGVYEGGKKYHLWERIHLPAWVQKITQALTQPKKREAPPPPAEREPPLMFVNINPDLASAEPPKNAKYYAAQSTRAANPDAEQETGIPKIDGTQERVLRTEDSQRSKAQPLQPAPMPKPEKQVEPEPDAKPKPTLTHGDLTLAKPEDQERKTEPQPEHQKPRTVAEAKQRLTPQQRAAIASEKTKQNGGVRERNIASTLDAIGSPFGTYDAAIVAAIQNRWYDLLEQRAYASDRTWKVVLEFRLNYDGRVTDMKVVENTVDEILSLLCQKAILDPAPFGRWPSDMRRMVGADYREVRFGFYYN